MTFLELLVFAAFLAVIGWPFYYAVQQEKRRSDAFVKKENAQRILYECLLQKLDEDAPWANANG